MIMAQKKKNFTALSIIVASLLIGFLVGYIAGFRYGMRLNRQDSLPAMPQQFQSQPSRIDLSSRVIEIVKELNCICSCKMELLPCTCDELKGSKEIKAFVQTLVGEGLSRSEALGRLVEKYGQSVLIARSS
jgi:cytochrome c-type biogenesis protein CcmH/NrfF